MVLCIWLVPVSQQRVGGTSGSLENLYLSRRGQATVLFSQTLVLYTQFVISHPPSLGIGKMVFFEYLCGYSPTFVGNDSDCLMFLRIKVYCYKNKQPPWWPKNGI